MTERKNTILVYGNRAENVAPPPWFQGDMKDNPARAWLQAILRALIDMEGKP
ncbi:MAG: hypothetical protein MRY77_14155 [Rhodobacteraceae bacterium]|nr:hypothetical protein [Paracoccaceae bacterium]